VLSGFLLTGLVPLAAQETRVARDAAFVRKLATSLNFTSLAKSEVERLQAVHKDSADFKEIFQLGIEISLIGARSHPNREERRTLFKDALQQSSEFIERYSDEPVADRARRTMIEACYEYGAYLLDEISIARDEAPETVAELEEQASDVYKDGISACEKVMDGIGSRRKENGSERSATTTSPGCSRRCSSASPRAHRPGTACPCRASRATRSRSSSSMSVKARSSGSAAGSRCRGSGRSSATTRPRSTTSN
jgi:hypothetical protein